MKKTFIFFLVIFLLISSSSCNQNPFSESDTATTPTTDTGQPVAQVTLVENQVISPCGLIDMTEMETLFGESLLYSREENGRCIIENQWSTRSIWFFVFQGPQALPALRWNTSDLISGWNDPDLQDLVQNILSDPDNNSLVTLLDARMKLYEKLEYHWQRIYTIGDSAYWMLNPWAAKGILDIVERDRYFQIGFSGFDAAKIQPDLEDLGDQILKMLPDSFSIDFQIPVQSSVSATPSPANDIPQILNISKSLQEIYYGNLCGDETTTIQTRLSANDNVENVYIVYRLISQIETNDNWATVFMQESSPSVWEIQLSAENSFNSYSLVNGAKVEYSIAVIYNVDSVYRSDSYSDITILQCRN